MTHIIAELPETLEFRQIDSRLDYAFEESLKSLVMELQYSINENILHENILHEFALLERTTLLRISKPSLYQEARLFYMGGRIFERLQRQRKAHECYDMCYRRIKPSETDALLYLHSAWAPIATALDYPLYALHSCQFVVANLQSKQGDSVSNGNQQKISYYQEIMEQCRVQLTHHLC